MTYQIKIAARKDFESRELWEMHRLRAKVFKERMGWEVPVIGGMEIDGYDALDPYYLLVKNLDKQLHGCLRFLPTEGPYMLKDTFPQLLHGHPAPQNAKTWEISRFAIEADGKAGFGFSGITLDTLREIVKFGDRMGIERYAIATTVSIERLMRRAGLAVSRFGPPIRIGVEIAVALDFDIGEQTHTALFGKMLEAA